MPSVFQSDRDSAGPRQSLDAVMNDVVSSVTRAQRTMGCEMADLDAEIERLRVENTGLKARFNELTSRLQRFEGRSAFAGDSGAASLGREKASDGGKSCGAAATTGVEFSFADAPVESCKGSVHDVDAAPFVFSREISIKGVDGNQVPVHGVATQTSASGIFIATAAWDRQIRLYGLTSEWSIILDGEDGIYSIAFAQTKPNLLGCTSCNHMVYLWDWKEQTCLHRLKAHTDEVNAIDFHSSQAVMATVSDDRTLRIWDFEHGQVLRVIQDHEETAYGVTFLGEENQFLVATCSFDNTARIFDMRFKTCVETLTGHTDDVIGIDYSSSRQVLATGSDDGSVNLWDARMSWRNLAKLNTRDGGGSPEDHEVKRVAFSPNGALLAAACSSGNVLVYDVESFERYAQLGGHEKCAFAVAWGASPSPRDAVLVSASHDATCRVWKSTDPRHVL
mmetsp:Transcript_87976/g.247201  ORF Transcript_87976/g.247201 Transcript_87976/m.247201 type:complete len:449 (+) Transcript_87976:133-1479(+)